jgi:molybdopterin synthase catalytic subunit
LEKEIESSDAESSMANAFCEIFISEKPLDLVPAAFQPNAGAVVDFLGVVRAVEEGENIIGIFYEAHREMALHQLQKISEAARAKFGCEQILLHHRIGFVPVAKPSLFVRVTA